MGFHIVVAEVLIHVENKNGLGVSTNPQLMKRIKKALDAELPGSDVKLDLYMSMSEEKP